jgi:fructose-1,6-bisphosphatase/inositol monophosphatase family enzyme
VRLDIGRLLQLDGVLRAAARAEIMPRFRRLAASEVRWKQGPLDLVTAADEAAEALIEAGLARVFPGAVVIGEEACARDQALLHRLDAADLAFVVDPVDGTANFAAGVPLFAVMAAAIARGEVIAAAIHDPVGDDSFLALRGEGAWIERADGSREGLQVAPSVPARQMTGSVSWRYLPEEERQAVCARFPRFASLWDYRCAGHLYRTAAAGHCHMLYFHRLMPWDHAPGWLLHREAGGYSATPDGSDYRPSHINSGLLCAPDRAAWDSAREALFG